MSLVTRCTSCRTTFKVVADQLRISNGWVRCGHCGEIFDAGVELYETDAAGGKLQRVEGLPADATAAADMPATAVDAPAPIEEPVPLADKPPSDAVLPLPMDWPAPEMLDLRAPPPESSPVEELHDEFTAAVLPPPSRETPGSAPGPRPLAMPQLVSPSLIDEAAEAKEQQERRERIQAQRSERAEHRERTRLEFAAATTALRQSVVFSSAPPADPDPLPSFAEAADPAPKNRRRGLWIILCLLALAMLLLQIVRAQRDLIAARAPALRPALEWLCRASGCELAALRDIAAITIDGAAFSREKNGEGYRLDFTLRSSSSVPLAMPAVELSLLDTQERTVVRRVLTPAQFGASAVLPARTEYTASLPVELSGPEAASLPPVAGYRLIAFYP